MFHPLSWRLVAAFLLTVIFASAQEGSLNGAREAKGRPLPGPLAVELVDTMRGFPVAPAEVARDGVFQFDGLASGSYELEVTNAQESILAREIVTVRRGVGPVTVTRPAVKPFPSAP